MRGSNLQRGIRSGLALFAGALTLLLVGQGSAWAESQPSGRAPLMQGESSDASVTNEWCPVITDEPVDPEVFTEYRGETVFLCCRKCLKKFRADPEAYAGNLPALALQMVSQDSGDVEPEHGDHEHAEAEAQEAPEHGHDSGEPAAHAEAEEHDHANHGDGDGSEPLGLVGWLGRLHPMVVHFPVALLVMAAAAELLLILTGAERFGFAARFCLWGGALGALAAASLGWTDALSVEGDYVGFSARLLLFHRWVGVSTALVAGAALFACERTWRSAAAPRKGPYRALLFLSALLVSVAGHLGASLIYGWEYLSW